MMTQLELACQGKITQEMEIVARKENLTLETVRSLVAEGKAVIPANKMRQNRNIVGFGSQLRTKVSASIGTPKNGREYAGELAKLEKAIAAGTDSIMDLSLGGDLDYMRREVLKRTELPVGTLPIYQTCMEASLSKGILALTPEDFIKDIAKQAKDGVDFMGLHCGMTRRTLDLAKSQGRVNDVVSWGGSLLAGWMLHHNEENPLYTYFNHLLEVAVEYDVTLSLADGLRPGCLADSLDRAQVQELVVLGELVDRARAAGVQVMIKGPGHAPWNHLAATVQLMKQMCQGAPYFVFGPIATDIAPGYDHITAAIGGAFASAAGADFLCYVTPAEHVRFPTGEDVYEGVMAARVAAHIGDLAKETKGALDLDLAMAQARKPWNVAAQRKLALDPAKLGADGAESMEGTHHCTRCRDKCSMKVINEYFARPLEYC
jgi:phosphomethylpyrimidine synthase